MASRFLLVVAMFVGLAACAGDGSDAGGGGAGGSGVDGLVVAAPSHRPYSRDAFGSGWRDADGDCLDTRAEVLISESSAKPKLSGAGCTVASGRWRDAYTGSTITDAHSLDIDHVVPLAEAWRSGAWRWSSQRRADFANDMRLELLPVAASLNRSKGDQDPAEWMPPNAAARCAYARRWITIKRRWGLEADAREAGALRRTLGAC